MANNFHNIDGIRYQFSDEEQSEWEAQQAKQIAARQVKLWVRLRQERDALLQESDWRFGNDAPDGAGTDAWKLYRSALRDLPSNTSDPANPTWPSKPE
jgi:hypothetical protein